MSQKEDILYLEETNSTNTYIKELYSTKRLPDGFTVCTDYQTAGRGQRGNSWEAERAKNLLFSIILYPTHLYANQQFLISEAISLAIKDVLVEYTADISIKWPNDIYWQEKKIAGILIENALTDIMLNYSIIGVGLNVNQDEFTSNAPNPVSLKQIIGQDLDRSILLRKIQDRLFYYYDQFDTELLNKVYNESLFRKGGWHWYSDHKTAFLAQLITVEKDGMLVLRLENNTLRTFFFKEIKFLFGR